MKSSSLKINFRDYFLNDFPKTLPSLIPIVFLTINKRLTVVNFLASFGVGMIAFLLVTRNQLIISAIFGIALLLITYYVPEGFTTLIPTHISTRPLNPPMEMAKKRPKRRRQNPSGIVNTLQQLRLGSTTQQAGFRNMDDEEGFMDTDDEEGYSSLKNDDEEEGFMNKVFQNISTAGYTSPGFGVGAPLVEGFEDEKKPETKSKPAPVAKKEEMAMPFKLGEIPSQVKNGPHIDASSTLMKAIQSLNPEQISAMTNDTKQLIETQKSLMGMLGTMKPMMNDGKELMETFQEMFGKQ